MSYDPFAAQQPRRQHSYHDSADFNPYTSTAPPPHASYDQGAPYKDEGPLGGGAVPRAAQAEDKEFDPFQPPPKSTGDLRMWRHDHHGNLWVKGGRGRCIGRFCCCSIMVVLLLLVSIILTLAIFLRPPDIEFSGVQPSASGSAVEATSSDLKVNLGIGISVRNPNFFTVTFKSITASVSYPLGGANTQIGGGTQKNVVFPTNSKTAFTFPFTIEYSQAADPGGKILIDIATKCGFVPGSAKQQLKLNYSLTLAIQILFVTISPPIDGQASFDCPFSLNDIKPLVGSIPALAGILNGAGGA